MARIQADRRTLEAALIGFQIQLQQTEQKMSELRHQIGISGGNQSRGAATTRPRRTMSAAAKKRIAAAQKKRWAEYRKRQDAKS